MPEGEQQQQQEQQQQTPPWHAGIEPETLGFWQNKGYKIDDPKALAAELTKQYRAAEQHIGAPPDQILRLPKADARPEDVKAFWARLGAADAKDYDFSGVKLNGQPLDEAFATTLRESMARNFVPKDRAAALAADVAKHMESADTANLTVYNAKLAEEKATLAKNWGTNFDFNHLKAMEGARKLGITPEGVKALEGQIGYAAVMEAMRKIGSGTSEDVFVEGNRGPGGNPTTREGAMARKAELMADTAWCARYTKGGVAERQEMDGLNMMIDGERAAA